MANATFIPTFDVTAEASRAGRFGGHVEGRDERCVSHCLSFGLGS